MGLEDSRQFGGQGARGKVLHAAAGAHVFSHDRVPVTGPAADVVSHLWWVRWGQPEGTAWTQQVLSDPVVQLTVEQTGPFCSRTGRPPPMHGQPMPAALVHGPVTRLWRVELPPQGRTSGIAFHPGGFAALLDRDVSGLAGAVVDAPAMVPGFAAVRDAVLAEEGEYARRGHLLDWLERTRAAAADRIAGDLAYRSVRAAVRVMRHREHVRVSTVAEATNISPRTLHRWFARYVGVSPLQVLRRHRLQDAVAALELGQSDLAALAAELGWSDQGHFSREFRAVVGLTPGDYRTGVATRVAPLRST